MKFKDIVSPVKKRLWLIMPALLGVLMIFGTFSCRQSEEWNEMPDNVADFVEHYFPTYEVSNFTKGTNSYHVRLDNGPGLTFDRNGDWVAIDGYGMPLPQVLLFDQLPPKMYGYLQETEVLNGVFSIERDAAAYSATLLESTLRYIIATGELTMR